ncbi:MAG TPA: VWA domain-containing protein [Spirochaetota bacterium]|nr:VWA domain-containing protein [Spirochaetota bacterium]HOS32368.1 VWA domain-containing protein [Spirochaetota bacterium]HOS55615.1 VWA domain-containing protein [Spirochaetota bacterium]HPK62163.1 VWA domain-containing protein [Spirochaetota bacterium]HQF78147.1 VWA domain-containing protein [Spirochaetota bacterium]
MEDNIYDKTIDLWTSKWDEALSIWSKYIRLEKPTFCVSEQEHITYSMKDAVALIRLTDHKIFISIRNVYKYNLQDYPIETIGHEIGHHVYCPGNISDMARLIVRIRNAMPRKEYYSSMICNLYTDILVNDRLFRDRGIRIEKIYLNFKSDDKLWNFYMRIYEILWGLSAGFLTSIPITPEMEGDAQLANRIIRTFSNDWIRGAGRFAAVCYSYIFNNDFNVENFSGILDSLKPGTDGALPEGLTDIEEDEGDLSDIFDDVGAGKSSYSSTPREHAVNKQSQGNYRTPFQYGEIIKSLGLNVKQEDILASYYKERAMPYLISFPKKITEKSSEPIHEGLDLWDFGSGLEKINWMETIFRSPVVIPGYTTFETHYGTDSGFEKEITPIDLDIYIDSSGSMPNPSVELSYLSLAGVIISLSALRSGSKVQATLWSGKTQFITTNGFIRDEKKIFSIITGFFGGSTQFPIHILRDTYQNRKKNDRKVHILHISDEGIDTMYGNDEKGVSGEKISEIALEKAGGGGTMVLNLWKDWKAVPKLAFAAKQGWNIYRISSWEELINFSKEFVKRNYDDKKK